MWAAAFAVVAMVSLGGVAPALAQARGDIA